MVIDLNTRPSGAGKKIIVVSKIVNGIQESNLFWPEVNKFNRVRWVVLEKMRWEIRWGVVRGVRFKIDVSPSTDAVALRFMMGSPYELKRDCRRVSQRCVFGSRKIDAITVPYEG